MAIWVQFSNFVFHYKKANDFLGKTVEFRIWLGKNEWPFGYTRSCLFFKALLILPICKLAIKRLGI